MKRGFSLRGQVTIFVIITIFIVGIGGGVGYFVKVRNDVRLNEEFFSQSEIKVQVDSIESSILGCMENTGVEGLKVVGLQGGYYNKPLKSFEIEDGFIPYYYDRGEFLIPSREDIERELEEYFSKEFGNCIDNLEYESFDLKLGSGSVNVVIGDDKVLFEVEKNVRIEKDGKKIVFDLDEHSLEVKSALRDILEVAEYLTDSHKKNAKMYCINCVGEIASERDLYVQRSLIGDNSVLVIIGENRTGDNPYLFNYLNKYNGDEIDDFKFEGDVPNAPVVS